MQKFTKEQMEQLKNQTEQMMELLAEEKGAKEICAQMYADQLPDKTYEQGEAMADAILESIAGFDHDYEHAKADVDAFVDTFLETACKDKTLAERCTYLMKLLTAITAAKSTLGAKTEEEREEARQMVEEADAASILDGEATEALEAKLRDQVKNALKGSNIILAAMEVQREALQEIQDEDETAALLVEAGVRNTDFRAIMAMQAYINTVQGTYEEIPADLTAAQAATMVCTYEEEARILQQVAEQHLGEDVAHALLSVLGIVTTLRMAIPAMVIGVNVCFATFGWIVAIPASLVVITTATRVVSRIVDAWIKDSKKIVHTVSVGVKSVLKGIATVASYVAVHVPVVAAVGTRAHSAVLALLGVLRRRKPGKAVEESVTAEDLEAAVEEEISEEEPEETEKA